MTKMVFDYEVNDNASNSIESIHSKFKNLRGEYREVKKTMGDLREGLNVLNGLGIGLAGNALSNLGLSKEKQSDSEKSIFKKQETSKIGEILGQVGRFATFTAGGVIASRATPAIQNAIDSVTSTVSGRISGITTGVAEQVAFSATDRLVSGSRLGSASRLGGVVGSGLGRGLIAGIATGVAGLGIGLLAQAAYEYGIKPSIDQFTEEKSYSDEYLKNLSGGYLANTRKQSLDTWKQSNEGDYGPSMWLLREVFGKNKAQQEELEMQLSIERAKRNNEISKALYLQNRD